MAGSLFDSIIESPLELRSGGGVAIFHIVDEQPVPVLRDLADRVVNAQLLIV